MLSPRPYRDNFIRYLYDCLVMSHYCCIVYYNSLIIYNLVAWSTEFATVLYRLNLILCTFISSFHVLIMLILMHLFQLIAPCTCLISCDFENYDLLSCCTCACFECMAIWSSYLHTYILNSEFICLNTICTTCIFPTYSLIADMYGNNNN